MARPRRKYLTPEQRIAIEWLSLPKNGGKTYEEIAEMCGVTDRTIRNWKQDELFVKELNKAIVRNTQEKLPEVFEAAIEGIIKEKNAAMFRTLLQAHGILTEKHEIETKQNVSVDTAELKAEIERFKQRLKNRSDGGN